MNILDKAKELLAKYGPPAKGKPPLVAYRMGADLDGDPLACDCSAFVARCCSHRKFDGKLYWNTDRIYGDAVSGHQRWESVRTPRPGDIGVYPGKFKGGKRIAAGHVWVVLDPEACTTIECSSSGKGICSQTRKRWFQPGAMGNGKPILWARFVG